MRLTIAYNSNHLHLSLSGCDLPDSEQQGHIGTRDFFRFFVVASCSIFLSHGVTEINNKSSIFVMYYLQCNIRVYLGSVNYRALTENDAHRP